MLVLLTHTRVATTRFYAAEEPFGLISSSGVAMILRGHLLYIHHQVCCAGVDIMCVGGDREGGGGEG